MILNGQPNFAGPQYGQQNLGDFQMALRNWLGQRNQFLPGDPQGWLAQRPSPQSYGQQPMMNLGDLMAQHPGRNWHPGMMMVQRLQGGM